MSTKPATLPRWATDLTNNDAPSSGQQDTGWTPGQTGVSDYDNWAKYWTYKWVEWLNDGDVSFRDLYASGQLKLTGIAAKTLAGSTTTQDLDVAGSGNNLLHIYAVNVTVGGANAFLGGIAGGVDGLEILLVHVSGSNSLGLKAEDTGSTAGNRILFNSGATDGVTLAPNEILRLRYVGALSRWVVLNCKAEHYGYRSHFIPIEPGQAGATSLTFNTTVGADGMSFTSSATNWTWWSMTHGAWGVRSGEQLLTVTTRFKVAGAGTFATARLYQVNTSGVSSELENWSVTAGAGGWGSHARTLATPVTIGVGVRYLLKLEGTTSGDMFGGCHVVANPFPVI